MSTRSEMRPEIQSVSGLTVPESGPAALAERDVSMSAFFAAISWFELPRNSTISQTGSRWTITGTAARTLSDRTLTVHHHGAGGSSFTFFSAIQSDHMICP
jgi:hypothetical protein